MKRIFRSTNLRVWQKRKEPGFEAGSGTSLFVCIIGKDRVWIGTIGDGAIYIEHKGYVKVITQRDINQNGSVTRAIGFQKRRVFPAFVRHPFRNGDSLLMVNGNIASSIDAEVVRKVLTRTNNTSQALEFALATFFNKAARNSAIHSMSSWLIKRVAIED